MIIAIDFDGTIAKKKDGKFELNEQLRQFIRKWQSHGHRIVLWTCRQSKALEEAVRFLYENGIHPDAINDNIDLTGLQHRYGYNCRKVYYDLIIDDKFPFPIINQVLAVDHALEEADRGN